jgi:hypothetical protein
MEFQEMQTLKVLLIEDDELASELMFEFLIGCGFEVESVFTATDGVARIKQNGYDIAILDINDATKENEYHRIRMENMNEQDYKTKYQGLEHMFYNKEWFENIAKEFNLKIDIFDQTFKKYSNSKLRFNVIMEKL